MIRGSGEGDEEGGGGGERGTVTRNSRSPQDPALAVGGALQVVSSGEFQETGSGDFHTPQVQVVVYACKDVRSTPVYVHTCTCNTL